MNASVFIATSLDGFIARANDDLDWLPPGGGEEHGYDAFITTVDALVIGRRTFEKVLTFGEALRVRPPHLQVGRGQLLTGSRRAMAAGSGAASR